jgi:Flp pilus assembly protein TadG
MTKHKSVQRRLKWFQRDSRGTSAVEFAIIAPMLLAVVVGLADVSYIAYGSSNMQTAVRSGIHYAMSGGTDETVAQSQANSAWTRKPGDGVVTSAKVCKCAGVVVGDCNAFCADNSRPEMYITVTATGSLGGNFYSMTQTSSETVRVR